MPASAPAAVDSDDDMPEEVSHKTGRRLVEQQEEYEQQARAAAVEAARIKKRQRKERLKKRRDERRAAAQKDEDVLSTEVLAAAAAAARPGGDGEKCSRPKKKVKRQQRVSSADDAAGNLSDVGLLAAPRHVEGNVHVAHLPRADSATAALAAADRSMIALSGAGHFGDKKSDASATSSVTQFLAEQEALVGQRRVSTATFMSCKRRGAPLRFGSRAGWG